MESQWWSIENSRNGGSSSIYQEGRTSFIVVNIRVEISINPRRLVETVGNSS